MWYVYRIYYKSKIVYVGRTNNIENRMRQHMLGGKVINILKVSRIEFAELSTEADMNLYELYYILKLKPELNDKDIALDDLTLELPELKFNQFFTPMWDKWIEKAKLKQLKQREKDERIQIARDLLKDGNTTMAREILQQQIYMAQNSEA